MKSSQKCYGTFTTQQQRFKYATASEGALSGPQPKPVRTVVTRLENSTNTASLAR